MFNQEQIKGFALIVAGSVLLLHTLGLIKVGFDLLIIIGSVGLMAYGAVRAGLDKTIQSLIKKQ